MREKLYCDRCSKIDKDCGSMVILQMASLRYTNLKKSLKDDESGKGSILDKSFAAWVPLTLCDDCYIEFMKYKTEAPSSQKQRN